MLDFGEETFTHAQDPRTQRMLKLERGNSFHPIQVIYNGKLIGKNLLGFNEMIDCSVGENERELEGVHL